VVARRFAGGVGLQRDCPVDWRTVSRLTRLALALSASSLTMTGVLAAPASSTTTQRSVLVGELGIEGGAYPGGFHPTAGSVEVEFASLPLALERHVGKSGKFRIKLTPGQYTVIGCGPTASSTPSSQCSSPLEVTLAPGEVDHIQLVWLLAP
jgi:hypothetical protein